MNIGIFSRSTQLYSTRSLYQAGRRRGHTVDVIDHTRCSLLLNEGKPNVYYQGSPLNHLDAIIPRIGASVTGLGAAVINQFELMNTLSPTSAEALLRARDKLRCLQILSNANIPFPKTIMVGRYDNLHHISGLLGGFPIVVKLLESTHGIGVELAHDLWQLKRLLQSFWQFHDRILLQEFIKEAQGADIRALVVDSKVVASMKRQAQKGEFRSNLHRGASSESVDLSSAELDLVSNVVKAMDIELAGVDIILSNRGPLVMEVNASPGLEGIEKTTGVDVAGNIIHLLEKKVKQKRANNTKIL